MLSSLLHAQFRRASLVKPRSQRMGLVILGTALIALVRTVDRGRKLRRGDELILPRRIGAGVELEIETLPLRTAASPHGTC